VTARRLLPLVLALCLLLAGCGARENSAAFYAMSTYMTIRAWDADDALLRRAEETVAELEQRLSVTREDSELAVLNRTGTVRLSADGAALLRRALALCAATDGALDLSVYPVVRAWGFTTQDYRVPDAAELDALLARVDYTRVTLEDDGTVTVPAGMELDLGAVAKGWAGDRLAQLLRDGGVTSAILSLGGNVQTVGARPDGDAWNVAVRDPSGEGMLGVVRAADEAVVTSGGYERYFVDDAGVVRWHIMDPATGYPARSGLVSVTVVGAEGVVCDALSTALFVMGAERAEDYWRAHRDFECLLVTEDGALLLTPGLAARFTPADGLSYEVRVIADA